MRAGGSAVPVLVGVGALGLLALAAAGSSPVGRSAARRAGRIAGEAVAGIADWIPTVLRKTSEHEGTFWSVQRNLDGNGVSYGILQWTQKSGSLGKLLRAMYDADVDAFRAIFGAGWARLLDATGRASLDAVDGAVLWTEPWLSRFDAAGRWPAFQAVQVREAAQGEYMRGAVEIAGILGVATERAMVLYFNRTVHQGVAGAIGPARRLAAWYAEDPRRRPAHGYDVLAQYAWLCAARFRRTTPPPDPCFTRACNVRWEPVTSEWTGLGVGSYAVRRVAVSGVWHAVTGPAGRAWSLWDLIVRRSGGILTDPGLRDVAVAVPSASLAA